MRPEIALLISQVLDFAIELWRNHAGKTSDWRPTQQDWDDLAARVAAKSAEDYKRPPDEP